MIQTNLSLLCIILFLIKCAPRYDMGPGARLVILPITAPRNRTSEYIHQIVLWIANNIFIDFYLSNLRSDFFLRLRRTHKDPALVAATMWLHIMNHVNDTSFPSILIKDQFILKLNDSFFVNSFSFSR